MDYNKNQACRKAPGAKTKDHKTQKNKRQKTKGGKRPGSWDLKDCKRRRTATKAKHAASPRHRIEKQVKRRQKEKEERGDHQKAEPRWFVIEAKQVARPRGTKDKTKDSKRQKKRTKKKTEGYPEAGPRTTATKAEHVARPWRKRKQQEKT